MRQALFDAAFLFGAFAGAALALAMACLLLIWAAYWAREFCWELAERWASKEVK